MITRVGSPSSATREKGKSLIKTLHKFEFGPLQEPCREDRPRRSGSTERKRTKLKRVCEVRLAARAFKPKREGPRDDLVASTPRLEAKKASFRIRGRSARDAARARVCGGAVDVRRREESAPHCARCDEEEWVELPDEFENTDGTQKNEEIDERHEESRVGKTTTDEN